MNQKKEMRKLANFEVSEIAGLQKSGT